MDPTRATVRISFIETLKQLDPLDALILQNICNTPTEHEPSTREYMAHFYKIMEDEVAVSLERLQELNCASPAKKQQWIPTAFGRELVRACRD